MLQFIQRVQTNTWRDLSKLTKTTQITTIEVTEKKTTENGLLEAPQAKPRSTARLENPLRDDVAFARILDAYLPPQIKERAEGELAALCEAAVSEQVMDWIAEAERCPAQIQHWDAWGVKKDELVTSQGWKYLWQYGISER
jgi:hypothetical protein